MSETILNSETLWDFSKALNVASDALYGFGEHDLCNIVKTISEFLSAEGSRMSYFSQHHKLRLYKTKFNFNHGLQNIMDCDDLQAEAIDEVREVVISDEDAINRMAWENGMRSMKAEGV